MDFEVDLFILKFLKDLSCRGRAMVPTFFAKYIILHSYGSPLWKSRRGPCHGKALHALLRVKAQECPCRTHLFHYKNTKIFSEPNTLFRHRSYLETSDSPGTFITRQLKYFLFSWPKPDFQDVFNLNPLLFESIVFKAKCRIPNLSRREITKFFHFWRQIERDLTRRQSNQKLTDSLWNILHTSCLVTLAIWIDNSRFRED